MNNLFAKSNNNDGNFDITNMMANKRTVLIIIMTVMIIGKTTTNISTEIMMM